MEAKAVQEITRELKAIRKELHDIKEHLSDKNTILSPEEQKALNEAIAEYKIGKSIAFEDLEKELNK